MSAITIQSYHFNNKTVDVDLVEAHELSSVSKEILQNLYGYTFPTPFRTAASLKDRIQTMRETETMLKEAHDHAFRYKLKALIKSVFVDVLAAGIILFMKTPYSENLYLIPFVGFVYCGINLYISILVENEIKNIERRDPGYQIPNDNTPLEIYASMFVKPFLGGIVYPLSEASTREARIKRVVGKQRESIREAFKVCKEENDKVLPSAYQFYKTRSAKLIDSLNRKISLARGDLAQLSQADVPNQEEIKRVENFIITRDTALEELQKLVSFYQQWDS